MAQVVRAPDNHVFRFVQNISNSVCQRHRSEAYKPIHKNSIDHCDLLTCEEDVLFLFFFGLITSNSFLK